MIRQHVREQPDTGYRKNPALAADRSLTLEDDSCGVSWGVA